MSAEFLRGMLAGAVCLVSLLASLVAWRRERAVWRRLDERRRNAGPVWRDLAPIPPKPRPLPVLRRCRDCAWCGLTLDGWSCDHEAGVIGGYRDPLRGRRIDRYGEPPTWCPLRGER